MIRRNFLELDLLDADMSEVIEDVFRYLNDSSDSSSSVDSRFLFTPNPEMYVEIQGNFEFKSVLKKAYWLLPDGVGVKLWAKLFGVEYSNRLTGVDFLDAFLSENIDQKVYLVGGAAGSAQNLANKYSEQIVGIYDGQVSESENAQILSSINDSGATVVFVALGAPKQELWINSVSGLSTGVKLWVGVGGAFDFLAGKQFRAPKFFRLFALEWLYRLYREPSRIKRIYSAVFVFSWICVKAFFSKK